MGIFLRLNFWLNIIYNMEYFVGQELIFIGDNPYAWTKGKTYKIIHKQVYHYFDGIELKIVRDDNEVSLWWDSQLDENFITLKEQRKRKLEQLSKIG
jgi:hypothetical protein